MLILSRVCAEFRDRTGAPVFTVTPQTRLTFQEAPDCIRDDPLFGLLLRDRSLEVAEDKTRRKQLENEPEALPDVPGTPAPENPDSSAGAKPRKGSPEKKG